MLNSEVPRLVSARLVSGHDFSRAAAVQHEGFSPRAPATLNHNTVHLSRGAGCQACRAESHLGFSGRHTILVII